VQILLVCLIIGLAIGVRIAFWLVRSIARPAYFGLSAVLVLIRPSSARPVAVAIALGHIGPASGR